MPQPTITRAVVRAVEELPGFPVLSVLELSCGEGEILSKLAERGCRVQGTHYREDDYIVKHREHLQGLNITSGVSLHHPLPFDSDAYDVVLLIEVLEHLENHFSIVAEASRVLKPGGYLLITTPNIFRLHSRLQFFLTGKHKLISRRFGWDLPPEERYAYHITPVDFPLMHAMLYHAGLVLQTLRMTRWKAKSLPLLLLWPLVRLSCLLTVDRPARRSERCRAGERDLNRWLSHPVLLCSEQLFLVARRQA